MSAETASSKGSRPTRLAIVDDHDFAREGLRDMLADEPDIEVVGEAANGREAIALCSRLQPDLILMDVRMPQMDGLSATQEIKQKYPRTSVLMVTMHEDPDYLLEALKAGAAGYILKDASQQEVITAVQQVCSGESPLDQELAARLLRRLAAEDKGQGRTLRESLGSGGSLYTEPLTRRELEVLGLLKEGYTNRRIARELFISPGTAKNHVEHILAKLGASDRTQAVVRALELGLVNLSD
jgi:DNA-binding NarL/FixJ family response regulator